MALTYADLKAKPLAELRELARTIEHDAVQGYSQMNKDHLLPALCRALGIDLHEHHTAVGIDKAGIKAKMRQLKAQRDTAIAGHDAATLHGIRRQLHHLNRQIRSHLA